ncbi:MAG: SAM-dependent chlorinase/fluorinase [Flavobacteriaceae bacterium]|nr:SAM-dependent chlorinase/fluorinase [Flavobacteriaceae bacterium]MCI5088488.1 SAM-dependent chlorinase/fluorinase [Flavobacteriaceae bacterium]CAI8173366.1 MAG: Adenosyl-chloride synthase [SAR116 cluster bacterium]
MAIITLTTDFGLKDHFVAAVKGAIYSELEAAKIVDISHLIRPFHIQECAYILKNAYHHFPKGSIHIVGVDAEKTPENDHIVVYVDGHYFICANTGVVHLICASITPDKVVRISLPNEVDTAFPTLEIFVKVACHIARGGSLDVIGKPLSQLKELIDLKPKISEGEKNISGAVMYIDNYENVVINIHQSFFHTYQRGRKFTLSARHKKINQIHRKYSDIIRFDLEKDNRKSPGELLAIFNEAGYLELAIYKGSNHSSGGAATLLGLDYLDHIVIEFD